MIITFEDPIYLWMLWLLPLLILTHFYSIRYVKKRALRFANFEAMKRISGKKRVSTNWLVMLLRASTIFFMTLAAAGAVFWYSGTASNATFVLAIDASGSMLADDFEPNRLEAAKQAALLFSDTVSLGAEIGVVSFSGVGQVEQKPTNNFIEAKF